MANTLKEKVILLSTLKAINKVVTPKLSELGFLYSGKRDPISWGYSRIYKDAEQHIYFEKISSNPNRIRFVLGTSVSLETASYKRFAKELPPLGMEYTDEASLCEALNILTEIIIKQGLSWLDVMSTPDVRPSAEMNALFMNTLAGRAERFIQAYNLNYSQPNFVELLQDIVREQSLNGEKEADWEFIMDASAALGEYIRNNLGGEWADYMVHKMPGIVNIGEKQNIRANPIFWISRYWGRPYYDPYELRKMINGVTNLSR
ncbi:hypothetical protein AB6A23_01190 [Paenibacillus tarimensis]